MGIAIGGRKIYEDDSPDALDRLRARVFSQQERIEHLEQQVKELTAERDDLQSQLEGIGEGQAS